MAGAKKKKKKKEGTGFLDPGPLGAPKISHIPTCPNLSPSSLEFLHHRFFP